MKKAIRTTHHIKAPVQEVWSLIQSGANWENWFPILTGSRVEGTDRFCELENGDTLEEKFLASQAEMTFVYNVHKQASFPAENIVGIMRLVENGDGSTILYWSLDLEVADQATFEALNENVSGMYTAAAAQLEKLANEAVAA